MYKVVKRILDFIFSLFILPFVILLIALVGVAIKIEDRGPIFYIDNRLGKDGKIFKMYKLRSMRVNAPDIRFKDGSTYDSPDDERVTKIGKLIRKTSIDEIPQAFNVLKGDMSIIGPRPDSASSLTYYTEKERVIFEVRPGITGYNQVINRKSTGTEVKFKNDIIYVNNISFLFDLKIFIMTIKSVLFSKNVYREESTAENRDAIIDELKQEEPTSV